MTRRRGANLMRGLPGVNQILDHSAFYQLHPLPRHSLAIDRFAFSSATTF